MPAETVEYSAPEGLYAHEACFLLRRPDEKWFFNASLAAMLELVAAGRLVLVRDEKGNPRLWQDGPTPGPAGTPFLEGMAQFLVAASAGTARSDFSDQGEETMKRRLSENGWCDASGSLTAEGASVVDRLRGYRAFLRSARVNPVHMTAAAGKIDKEAMFAAAFGFMNFANVSRAVMTHEGLLKPGQDDFWLSLLGGKSSEQHTVSYRNPLRWGRNCLIVMFCLIAAFWIMVFRYFPRSGTYTWDSGTRSFRVTTP